MNPLPYYSDNSGATAGLRASTGSASVVTQNIFGHETDFLITAKTDGDKNVITVTTVMPQLRRQGDLVASFAPPRYPWQNSRDQKRPATLDTK